MIGQPKEWLLLVMDTLNADVKAVAWYLHLTLLSWASMLKLINCTTQKPSYIQYAQNNQFVSLINNMCNMFIPIQ